MEERKPNEFVDAKLGDTQAGGQENYPHPNSDFGRRMEHCLTAFCTCSIGTVLLLNHCLARPPDRRASRHGFAIEGIAA
jgi:hypothetical protein